MDHVRHAPEKMSLSEAKSRYIRMCELHRKFADDCDTEDDIENKVAKSKRIWDNLREKQERRQRYDTVDPQERLKILKEESKYKPNLVSLACKITAIEINKGVLPYRTLGHLDIRTNGDMIFSANDNFLNASGTLWCFRDIRSTPLPVDNSYGDGEVENKWVTRYNVDASFNGFGNGCAVGQSSSSFTGAVHVKDQHSLVFFADSSLRVGLARYSFLDQIKSGSIKTMPKTRIKMAEELNTGLFDILVKDFHLPSNKPRGKVIAISSYYDSRVLTGCEKRCFVVWDESMCRRGYLVNGIMGPVSTIQALSEIHDAFVVADLLGNWNICDLRARNAITKCLKMESDYISSFTVPPSLSSRYILAGTSSGKVKLFDVRMLKNSVELETIGVSSNAIRSLHFNPNGSYFSAASTSELTIYPWNQRQNHLSSPVYSYFSKKCITSVNLFEDCCYSTEIPGSIIRHNYA